MSETTAKATPLIENEKVIVTRWVFAPGDTTGFHVHERDYVVVPLSTGKLRIVARDGSATLVEDSGRGPVRRSRYAPDGTLSRRHLELSAGDGKPQRFRFHLYRDRTETVTAAPYREVSVARRPRENRDTSTASSGAGPGPLPQRQPDRS